MALQLSRHLVTLEEFERMAEAGVFDEDARLELIRGEIVEMTPIGLPHEVCVMNLTTLLVQKANAEAMVWPQSNSIRLPPSRSRPQPDVTLLRWRDDRYAGKRPTGEDVLLVVEVAESSLSYDRNVKGPLYAGSGIPEYWIVNLRDKVIEVYTQPVEGVYKHVRKARRGEMLALPAILKGAIQVNDVLGGE